MHKKCHFTIFTYSNAVEQVSQTVQGGVWIDALWQTAVEDNVGTVLGLTPAILQVHVHHSQSARGHQAGKEGFDGRQVRRDWPAVDRRGTDTGTAREKLGRTNRLHLNSKVSTSVYTIDCGYIVRAKIISFVSMCSFRGWRPSPYSNLNNSYSWLALMTKKLISWFMLIMYMYYTHVCIL